MFYKMQPNRKIPMEITGITSCLRSDTDDSSGPTGTDPDSCELAIAQQISKCQET